METTTAIAADDKKLGVGIVCMPPAFKNAQHKPDIPNEPGLTIEGVNAALIRQTWNLLEPVQGEYGLDYLVESIKTCNAAKRKVTLQVLAGQHLPPWFPHEECVDIEGVGLSTLVFTPTFQERWLMLLQAINAACGNNKQLVAIVMGGIGSGSESFVVKSQADIEKVRGIAQRYGYDDEISAWQDGVEWSMRVHDETFKQPFALVTGPPFGSSQPSVDALKSMFVHGESNYWGSFGARAHDYTSGGPKPGDLSYDVIGDNSRSSSATVVQAGNAQIANDSNPPTRLRQMLQRAYDAGANGCEVFPDDYNDERSWPVLQEFSALFLAR